MKTNHKKWSSMSRRQLAALINKENDARFGKVDPLDLHDFILDEKSASVLRQNLEYDPVIQVDVNTGHVYCVVGLDCRNRLAEELCFDLDLCVMILRESIHRKVTGGQALSGLLIPVLVLDETVNLSESTLKDAAGAGSVWVLQDFADSRPHNCSDILQNAIINHRHVMEEHPFTGSRMKGVLFLLV